MGSAAPAMKDGGVPNQPVLRRDSHQRVLGGVCAGLARTWAVDPLLVRVAALVVTVVSGGFGLVLYLLLWLALPSDAAGRRAPQWTPARAVGALVLLAAAGAALAPSSNGASLGFAVLGLLALAWFAATRRPAAPPPPAGGALAPGETPPVWQQPPGAPARLGGASAWREPEASWPPAPPPARAGRPRRGGWPLVLAAIGASWLVLAGAFDAPRPVAYPAAALGVLGISLLWWGRPRRIRRDRPRGLVAAGMVAALATVSLLGAQAAPAGSYRAYASAADLPDRPVELGVGEHVVDLSGLAPLDADRTLTLQADAGRLVVILPRGVAVHARYRVSMGAFQEGGHRQDGMDIDVVSEYEGGAGAATLTLDAGVDMGEIEVRR